MSIDPRADANRARQDAQNARINEAIAEDVAVGMAEKADHERAKANIYATQAAHKAEVAAVERHNREVAQQETRQTKFTLWLVLGIIAIGALALLAWAMSRPRQTDAPVVGAPTRVIVASPTAGPGVVITNPNNGVPVVPPPARPVQVRPPAPAVPRDTTPSVIVVPVPVERPGSPAAGDPAAPRASAPADSAPPAAPSSGGALEGYVEPTRP